MSVCGSPLPKKFSRACLRKGVCDAFGEVGLVAPLQLFLAEAWGAALDFSGKRGVKTLT